MVKSYRVLLLSLAFGAAACSNELTVVNDNNADAERALARPTDVEGLIANSFNTSHAATLGANSAMPQMFILGLENYSNLANFGGATRASIPRPPIANGINNPTANENYNAFLGLHRAARAAALGLSRINAPNFIFFPPSVEQNERARAFGFFVMGIALGQVALAYEEGMELRPTDDFDPAAVPAPLVGYAALMQHALNNLDSALAHAALMGTQTITATWVASASALSQAQFVAYIRGWKARLRSGVARFPADAAPGSLDWAAVRDDATAFLAGFPGGFIQTMANNLGWSPAWFPQHFASNSVNWHQMWQYMVGFAASQADYDAWLGTAGNLRQAFTVVSPDLRIPQGGANCPGASCRLAQQCQSGSVTTGCPAGVPANAGVSAQRPFGYPDLENRALGNDWLGDPIGNSQYRSRRFRSMALAANSAGVFPTMTSSEMVLTRAEAHYMLGNFVLAAGDVNTSRAAAGLPAAPTDDVTLVPGGGSCVPRIPVGPTFTSSACGNLWEALKWEKRMETLFTRWGGWYIDGRRWGDLPSGTPVHWPVPYQEFMTRGQTSGFPTTGGSGPTATPTGTYGL